MRCRGWILILGALGLAACGGGGGGGGGGVYTMTLSSDAALDGYLFADGSGGWNWQPGYYPSTAGEIYDGALYEECRQFYSFEHGAIPAGATIVSARLRLYQAQVHGDPYGTLGDVLLDHIHYDSLISLSYFDGNTFSRDVARLSTSPAIGYRDAVVTSAVRIDRADGRSRSQFRLRVDMAPFGILDGQSDYVRFTDAEGSAGDTDHPPLLILEVAVP